MIKGKRTELSVIFMLIHSTTLPITENKIKETIKGHKEVWTAKKGDINIIGF